MKKGLMILGGVAFLVLVLLSGTRESEIVYFPTPEPTETAAASITTSSVNLSEITSILTNLTNLVAAVIERQSETPLTYSATHASSVDRSFVHKQADRIYDVLGDTNTELADRVEALSTNFSIALANSTSSLVASSYQEGGNAFGVPALLGTTDNQSLSFLTNNTPRVTVTEGGNVGIGTAHPFSALHVYGDKLSLSAQASYLSAAQLGDFHQSLATKEYVYSRDTSAVPSGNLTHIDSDDQGGIARDVWGDGTFVYLANHTGGLHTYSVDATGQLTHIDSDTQSGTAASVWGDGTFIYSASYGGGLHTYSVDATGQLTHIDFDDQGDSAQDVWGDGKFIYLANWTGGLHTYSVDATGQLTHIDSDDQGDNAISVWGDGKFIYLANYTGGLHTYSVDATGQLTHIDSDTQGGNAASVWGDGTFIYLASYGGGLHTYSVDATGQLTHIDSDTQGGNARGVWGDGTFVYLVNETGGLHTYSVDDTGNLTRIDSDTQGGNARSVWGDGTFIYIASWDGGLHTYRVDNAYAFDTATQNHAFAVGNVGIGTTTPSAQLTVADTVRFSSMGAGSLQTDALGNVTVSSDERLKDLHDPFMRGIADLIKINPITYTWKPETGYDTNTVYTGFSAQNVQDAIPEAVSTDPKGFLTLSDRPILAAVINAVKEVWEKVLGHDAEIETLKQQVQDQQAEIRALQDALDIEPPHDDTDGATEEVDDAEDTDPLDTGETEDAVEEPQEEVIPPAEPAPEDDTDGATEEVDDAEDTDPLDTEDETEETEDAPEESQEEVILSAEPAPEPETPAEVPAV